MNSNLTIYLAKAHNDDLLRRAKKAGAVTWRSEGPLRSISAVANRAVGGVRRSTSARQEPGHSMDRDITIRFATASDELGLRRLAQLDSSAVPPPPVLIAEEDGETRAALSVLSANVVADHDVKCLRLLANRCSTQRRKLEVHGSPSQS
jgi:hypothetical protein